MKTDLTTYLASGIIEDYCLRLLNTEQMAEVERDAQQFPEIKRAIDTYQKALEGIAFTYAKTPKDELRKDTFKLIENLEKEENLNLADLPLINRFSDSNHWLKLAAEVLPQKSERSIDLKVLRNTEGIYQAFLWTEIDIREEVHFDEKESFLVLAGRCECQVGDLTYHLEPGDYMDIPLGQYHNVKIKTPNVLALLQRVAV